MSELEIRRRQEYKENRKKWSLIQLIAIAVLAAVALSTFLLYHRLDQTQYVEYVENSCVDYKVQYEENEFFDKEWIDKNQSYISSLIKSISADFKYSMNIASDNMDIQYEYWIDAKLLINSKNGGTSYYTVEERLLPMKSALSKDSSKVSIKETIAIDYVKYDEIARSFITTYDLKDATSLLSVTLYVKTDCSCEGFSNNCKNTYTSTLNIPVAEDSFSINSTQSSPAGTVKSFEYQGMVNRTVFLVIAIVCAALALLLAIGLVVFLRLTRNEDITYASRVRKILSAYGSFIQRVEGEFDTDGYQIVMIKTFTEMLGIRDTIQSPVLMFENKDETMTTFFIPTNTKILYVFDIKVDNYDDIYNKVEEPVVEEPVVEEPVILEEVDADDLAEAMAQPDVLLEDIEFIPDDDDQFEVAPEEPGIEVIGVVWPEKAKKNKVYRYDPNGESLTEGDIVLVPTMDYHKGREVIRKVAVAHGNHRVDPEHIKFPLKKIIAVIRHSLTPHTNSLEKKAAEAESEKTLE